MTFSEEFCYQNSLSTRKSITLMFMSSVGVNSRFCSKTRWQMFLLVSVHHVGAHPDELQHGVSIQSSINLGKTFPRISRIPVIPSTQILARVFVYLPPFISQILAFTCQMVLILFWSFFEWRDTENQQYNNCKIMRALGNGLSVELSVLFQSPVKMGKKSKTIGHTLYLSWLTT